MKKVPARRYVRSKDTICNYIHRGKKFIYIKNKGKKKKQRDPSKGRTRKLRSRHINNDSTPYFCVFFGREREMLKTEQMGVGNGEGVT